MEFVEVFLLYLQYGKDSPFENVGGGIKHIWNRSEIQNDSDGKHPHQHTLIYLMNHPKTKQECLPLLQVIRGSIETFANEDEKKELIEKGFLGWGKKSLETHNR